ncbi:lactate utilization protein C [Natrialbaceae archaeon GCM10025810]|uniref:LutC/YkgG family protein n=1 Tax=Halovalidus salilacus TaxID=3075124 RepID=UPI003606CC52
MATTTATRFERALEDLGVTVEYATAEEATERIAEAVEEPAAGVPLPFEGVSLPDDLETDLSRVPLESLRTGVTPARFAIAEYGSLAIESTPDGDEPVSLYPDRHVAVVAESDVLPDLASAFDRLEAWFAGGRDSVVFATGVSATADMGELVDGVHGPHDVHVIVVEDR